MFKIYKIIFFVITILIPTLSNAYEIATIKELKENIKTLEAKQDSIKQELDLNEIGDIKPFLRVNLSKDELGQINLIISEYKDKKGLLNIKSSDTIENIKKELLELKKETFKKLIPYIEESNLKEYLDFIRKNVEKIKQENEIKEKINQSKEILEAKVNLIKEKIKIHEDELKTEISDLINEKIDEKIEKIKNNPKFKILQTFDKKNIIEKTIEKIKSKKEEMLNTDKSDTKNTKKIEIYDVIIDKLKKLEDDIK